MKSIRWGLFDAPHFLVRPRPNAIWNRKTQVTEKLIHTNAKG